MILRIVAILSLALGSAALLLYLHLLGKGPWASAEARHLRQMKDRTAAPDSLPEITAAEMASLPRGAPLAEYAEIEARGATVEGYVQSMLRAVDGDYHLDLAPEHVGADGPAVPYVIAEVTPQWRRGSAAWSYEGLVTALRPRAGGITGWDRAPRRVRLSGWLLYDHPHEGRVPRPGSPPALTAWEIHPVTGIQIFDDSLGRFVEYPR